MAQMAPRLKKIIPYSITGLMIFYAILLIPAAEPEVSAPETSAPFVWNRDAYWSSLETTFLDAREMDSVRLADSIGVMLAEAERLLDSCERIAVTPSSPLLSRLETLVFETAPLLAVQPGRFSEFAEFHHRLRRVIKDQSRNWDLHQTEARSKLYRSLYGTRTAIEEIILQGNADAIDEPIQESDYTWPTPAAKMMGVTLHSGDILVSRGGAPTSALIARGNDYPGNFSHVALVHIDEPTGKISIIESHIECGVAVASVERYLDDTKLRIMVFRLRFDHPSLVADSILPHTAASLELQRAEREHIPYDFEMDFRDNRKLFCSEVVSDAYTQVGVTLWQNLSTISTPGVRSWLAAFGVTHFETQEPSDLEYDPQLEVIAEWRDPETLYKDHLDNAVTDVMLEGAEAGERLTYDWYMLPLARVMKAYSWIVNLWGGIGPVPEGMDATAGLKNTYYSERHEAIKKRLIQSADEFERTRGYRPPYWELVRLAREAKADLYGG